WWSDGLETQFGFHRAALEPDISSWTGRIHPEDRPRGLADVHAAIEGGAPGWTGEYRFMRSDGSYADVVDRGHIIHDTHGIGVRMIGGVTDITARRAQERRLVELAELVEKAQDAILVTDLLGQLTYVNARAERLHGEV